MTTDPGLIPLRDELAVTLSRADYCVDDAEEYAPLGDALLAPDGPLWPLLRALGQAAWRWAREFGPHHLRLSALTYLRTRDITGPLADACLAAADAKPTVVCTGIAATWCPAHGDCSCPPRYPHDPASERTLDDPACALHGDASAHAVAIESHPE